MKMLKKKSAILASIFMFAFLFSMVSVMAMEEDNITIVTPGVSGTLIGADAIFNVTLITGYEAENWTSVRIWLQSAGLTANTTEALATDWVTNETDLVLNGTLDSTVFEDGNDYIFKAQLFNGTDYLNQTRTGITINNGVPTAPTLSPADLTTRTTSGTQTFTGTVVDAETTSCTYTIYRGGSPSDGNSGSATYATTSCTFDKTFSTSADNGVWWFTVTASDGTDTTSSSTNKYNVNLVGSGSGLVTPLTVDGEGFFQEGNGWKWIIGIIIVLGIAGLIWAFKE